MQKLTMRRLQGVDGIRALAALSVLLYHTWLDIPSRPTHGLGGGAVDALISHLWLGLSAFFVLSGFLLYRPFVTAALENAARPSLRRYYRSRLLRIVPAYWFALTIILFVRYRDALAGSPWKWLDSYLFIQIYRPKQSLTIIGPAWTLCIEMSFYAALPFIAYLAGRVARTSRITHVLALTPLLAVGVGYQALGFPLALPGFIGQFALGMMLAVLTVKRDCLSATLRRALAALGACSGVAALTVANADGVRDNGGNPAFMLLAATALACGIGLALSSGRARKVLTIGPLVQLGVISYGVYLWHEPLIQTFAPLFPHLTFGVFLAAGGLFLCLAVSLASVSWVLVERRALRLKAQPRLPLDPAVAPA
jgi:peptidoglycan/LPS O-acetylase OafA/YrhL